MTRTIANVLTIAGSDSSGGAGLQADLKTFSALCAYGASVVTAITAQNTRTVSAVHPLPPELVTAQLDAVFGDIRIDAVKIGMLGDARIIHAVAAALRRYRPPHIILDPVMVATSGDVLLAPDALEALRDTLLPLADLVTPNLPELAALTGQPHAHDETEMARQGVALRALGARAVLVKGGHLGGDYSPDWLIEEDGNARLGGARVPAAGTHGTGCTLSAAIAALRPQRPDMASAVNEAKAYLTQALTHGKRLEVGSGIGPLHHFHAWW